MTSDTNRRAVLGADQAAGAIGVAPIASGAATPAEPVSGQAGLDAGLFALIDEAREIGARVEAGLSVLEEAEKPSERWTANVTNSSGTRDLTPMTG
jgi:hypothetical protein